MILNFLAGTKFVYLGPYLILKQEAPGSLLTLTSPFGCLMLIQIEECAILLSDSEKNRGWFHFVTLLFRLVVNF